MISLLPYTPEKFVDRNEERELVKEKASALSQGKKVRNRTVVFQGYKGSGRTWLLRKLADELPALAGVKALYVNLEDFARQEAETAVQKIRDTVNKKAEAWSSDSYALDQEPQRFRRLLKRTVFVLLLDHVYEAKWSLLEKLEDEFLAELVTQPHFLLVMAGRGKGYPWKTFEIREKADIHHLKKFERSDTKTQLEKQVPEAVPKTDDIYKKSEGYPLTNYLLAKNPEGLEDAVDIMLDGVSKEARQWLESVCVFRLFWDECILPMWFAYQNSQVGQELSGNEIRLRLLRTGMVKWDEEKGGYVVDGAVRPHLEKYLQQSQPETWKRLHCQAYRLYTKWAAEYPDERERWNAEADYHTSCLKNAGYVDDCLQD